MGNDFLCLLAEMSVPGHDELLPSHEASDWTLPAISSSSSSSRASTPSLELLAQYEQLMAETLPTDSGITHRPHTYEDSGSDEDHASPEKTMTKAEKQNAKKRRRKERARLTRLQGVIPAECIALDQIGELLIQHGVLSMYSHEIDRFPPTILASCSDRLAVSLN